MIAEFRDADCQSWHVDQNLNTESVFVNTFLKKAVSLKKLQALSYNFGSKTALISGLHRFLIIWS